MSLDLTGLSEKQLREPMSDRRERIATAAIQGVMASGLIHEVGYSELAQTAIRIADALIKELDKEVQP